MEDSSIHVVLVFARWRYFLDKFLCHLNLAFIGFYPYAYLKMIFPVIILLLMPMRHMVIPKIVPEKYLRAMDNAL